MVTLVVQRDIFKIVEQSDSLEAMVLSIDRDGGGSWVLRGPGWRSWSSGVGNGAFFIWTARQLLFLDLLHDSDAQVVEFDEDILLAFRIRGQFVVVCETSVRIWPDVVRQARVDFDEVIRWVSWEGDELSLHLLDGRTLRVRVADAGFTT